MCCRRRWCRSDLVFGDFHQHRRVRTGQYCHGERYGSIHENDYCAAKCSIHLQSGENRYDESCIELGLGRIQLDPQFQWCRFVRIVYPSPASDLIWLRTSPTAYNVISAYSVTSEYTSGDQCSTYLGTRISLSSAYSVALPTVSGRVILTDDNQDFINFLHISTCSNGGQSVTQIPLVQVLNLTVLRTSTIASQPLSAAGLTLASVTSQQQISWLHSY